MKGANIAEGVSHTPHCPGETVLAACCIVVGMMSNSQHHNPVEDIGGDESLGRQADVAHIVGILHLRMQAWVAEFEGSRKTPPQNETKHTEGLFVGRRVKGKNVFTFLNGALTQAHDHLPRLTFMSHAWPASSNVRSAAVGQSLPVETQAGRLA